MEIMTVAEASKEWGVTERRVLFLCNSGRVEGAKKFGWSWAIPAGTEKPIDARRRDEPQLEKILSSYNSMIRMERIWAMPNCKTFEIKPIKELILSELTDGLWIDPFANSNRIAKITNDLNPIYNTDYNLDALDFLKMFDDNSVDGILYDPPYSPRQVSECYNNVGYNVTWDTTKASFWGNHKREISRIIKQGGKVITFGWNSGGIGMKNGFEIKRILLVPHGGWHNDTICTVELKTTDVSPMPQISTFESPELIADSEIQIKDEALITQLTRLPQNFWDFTNTDTRELTHGLHNYPAIMVYPISRSIIKIMQSISPVKSLLDPFSGSGTVLVEGVLGGINEVFGNDLNPLAQLMSRVKTTPIKQEQLEDLSDTLIKSIEKKMAVLADLRSSVTDYIENKLKLDITAKDGWGSNAVELLTEFYNSYNYSLLLPAIKNIGYWYKPYILVDMQIIKECIIELPNSDFKDFVWLAFSETARIVSNRRNGEFKMYRMPAEKITNFNPDVKIEFTNILSRNIKKMGSFYDICTKKNYTPKVMVLSENSAILKNIPNDSIDLMITSPHTVIAAPPLHMVNFASYHCNGLT